MAYQKGKVKTYRTFYFNGKVKEEAECRGGEPYPYGATAGIRHGKTTLWYEDGQKSSEGEYRDGKEHGKWTYWHENGQKSAEGEYLNGNRHGKRTLWYDDGQKFEEGGYLEGKRHGQWKCWDDCFIEGGWRIYTYHKGKLEEQVN